MQKFIIKIDDDISDEKAFAILSDYIKIWKTSKFKWKPTYSFVVVNNNEVVIRNVDNYKSDTILFHIYKK